MPKLDGILETAIHTTDMPRSRAFYEGVLGLTPIHSDERLSAYAVAGRDVLLVFRKGATAKTVTLPAAPFPAMVVTALCMWHSRLQKMNSIIGRRISLSVELLSKGRNNWERGECATGIKVGPVFLLQLMTSFQIRVGETGGVHHVGHAVYCRLDRCCRTQPTRNHYRVHISRILKQDY